MSNNGGPLSFPRAPASKIALRLPILVQGIREGTELQPDALRVSLRGPDGYTENLSIGDCLELKRNTISTSAVTISAVCAADPEFFRRERGQPVTVRGSLYLTLFGNARSQALPLSDQPANALDGLQVLHKRRERRMGCVLPFGFSMAGAPDLRETRAHQCQFVRAVHFLLAVSGRPEHRTH